MPDLTQTEVRALLAADGISGLDDEDVEEIAHRVNALREALQALDFDELDGVEEASTFWQEEAR